MCLGGMVGSSEGRLVKAPIKAATLVVGLLLGSLSVTVALAWNDAIQKTIKSLFPDNDDQSKRGKMRASLVYASTATAIAIILFYVAAKLHLTSGSTSFEKAMRS